jgi:methionyl-tRNA synthetase
MDFVSYADFAKLDLRTATVENVEIIEGANKLYKLTVSLGKEKRTLIAGMRPYYSPEELKGKQIVVVANLEPKAIRGFVSCGMMLAADDGKNVVVLTPDKEIENGSKVR